MSGSWDEVTGKWTTWVGKCPACNCCKLCGADEPETLERHYDQGKCPYGAREGAVCPCADMPEAGAPI